MEFRGVILWKQQQWASSLFHQKKIMKEAGSYLKKGTQVRQFPEFRNQGLEGVESSLRQPPSTKGLPCSASQDGNMKFSLCLWNHSGAGSLGWHRSTALACLSSGHW
jgi:hypothetical protein